VSGSPSEEGDEDKGRNPGEGPATAPPGPEHEPSGQEKAAQAMAVMVMNEKRRWISADVVGRGGVGAPGG